MTSAPRIPRNSAEPPAPNAQAKAHLRQQLLATRRAVTAAQRAQWDRSIGQQIVAWWRASGPPALAVFWPLRDEPDLQQAYAELAALGAQLLLPVVLEKEAPLAFAAWQIGEPMVKDSMGVAVPAALRLAPCPGALLVPCLGYNAGRYRLGYGGGYYDRTLAQQPRPATIGVAYRCQQADFGHDRHDIALDRIITEA
jgi:5,10-methenyltetrahydrofolate synthetase